MKWSEAHLNPVMEDVKGDFIKELKLPQTDQQGLSKMWEIKQREGEATWDLIRRLKDAVSKLSYPIDPSHQRDWFIKALLPLTRTPLTQQRIDTLQDALEQAMKIQAMASYP